MTLPVEQRKAQFIKKAQDLHDHKYSYDEVEYVNNSTKVKIGCPVHGFFWKQPNNHLTGQGCTHCGNARAGRKLARTTESFIRDSVALHGEIFDYSKVDYVRNSEYLEIRCLRHDLWFKQQGATHLKYNGCPSCKSEKLRAASMNSTEDFVRSARERHGGTYDYSKVEYKSFREKVEIVCKVHGSFWQVAGFHLANRNGCPSCAHGGYSTLKKGTLYVLVDENVTKVGITNLTARDRLYYINPRSPYNFQVFKEYTDLDGALCEDTESEILSFLRERYESPTDKFHGYTESFFNVDREELIRLIEDKLQIS